MHLFIICIYVLSDSSIAKPFGNDSNKGNYYATGLVSMDLSQLSKLRPNGAKLSSLADNSFLHTTFLELSQV